MKQNIIMAILMAFIFQTAEAQESTAAEADSVQKTYMYRVYLTDKRGTTSLEKPLEFLSQKPSTDEPDNALH